MRKLIAAISLCLAAATGVANADEWVVKSSPDDVATTADRLEAAVADSPATLLARVDHQAAAAEAGLEMKPATVLIFGNSALGTLLMQANPRVALDLPLRVLVWQDGEETKIGYLAPDALAARYDITGADETLGKIANALDQMTNKAAAAE